MKENIEVKGARTNKKVMLHGLGGVKSQSIPAGAKLHSGMSCTLTLG